MASLGCCPKAIWSLPHMPYSTGQGTPAVGTSSRPPEASHSSTLVKNQPNSGLLPCSSHPGHSGPSCRFCGSFSFSSLRFSFLLPRPTHSFFSPGHHTGGGYCGHAGKCSVHHAQGSRSGSLPYSLHSLSRGGATAAHHQGLHQEMIKRHRMWSSDSFWTYITSLGVASSPVATGLAMAVKQITH